MGKRKLPEAEVRIQPGHPFFAIIEEAYQAFAVPPPSGLGIHDWGMDAAVRMDLLTLPSTQLSCRHVRDWYFAEVHPAGVPRQAWAYLLPRVLEMLALGQPVSEISLELSLSRFATGNPDNWSTAQWAVLDRFQRLYLSRAMNRGEASAIYHSGDRLDDVLCMFRLGGWPLDCLLEQLAEMPDALLAERLWRDWCDGGPPGCEVVWITSFWPEADREAISAWYTSSALLARMEALTMADDTPADQAEQALAVAALLSAKSP